MISMGTDRACRVTEFDREVVLHFVVPEEVLANALALVPQADDEVGVPVRGVSLHDVPENRTIADFDHRLGTILGLLPQSCPHAPTEQHDRESLTCGHNFSPNPQSGLQRVGLGL